MSETESKRPRWVVLTLSLMPLWLGLSAGGAVWWSLRDDKQAEEERNQRFAMEMSVERIADDLGKLEEVIGERSLADEDGRHALGRAASMLEGTLGPSNTGYTITKLPGPEGFPLICASLESTDPKAPSIWVLAAYDTSPMDDPDQWPQAAAVPDSPSSISVASLVAVAQAMARDELGTSIRFILLPHGNEPEAPVDTLIPILLNRFDRPSQTYIVHNMADSVDLFVLGSETGLKNSPPPGDLVSSFQVALGGAGNTALSNSLAQAGLPVLEVGTTLSGRSRDPRFAANIAISSGKLVEWLRRAARLEAAR